MGTPLLGTCTQSRWAPEDGHGSHFPRGGQGPRRVPEGTVVVALLPPPAPCSVVHQNRTWFTPSPAPSADRSILARPQTKKRWVNLWWPAEIGEDIASEECAFDAGGDLGALVFVGNLLLVVGILLGIFLLHVLIVSGVEAFWLTKVRRPFAFSGMGARHGRRCHGCFPPGMAREVSAVNL